MPNYACKLVNSSGTLTERSISAKSMGELYQIIDRSGERLISAKKAALNLSLDMDINQLLGREIKAKKLDPKDLTMFTRQLEMLLNTGIPMLARRRSSGGCSKPPSGDAMRWECSCCSGSRGSRRSTS